MYIKTGNKNYPCRDCWVGANTISFVLPEAVPAALGETVELCQDDGFVMRSERVADWRRWEVAGGALVLTNLPVPEPGPEPGPPEPRMTTEEAIMEMLTDIDYRTSLLELGIGGTV